MLILALLLNNLMTLISLLWPRILKPIIKQTKWHICIQFFDFWLTCQWQRSCELVLLTCVEALCQLTSLCVSQRCGPGFYRERAGPHRGQCVPCHCSGFSSECEAQTGKCMVGVQEMQQQQSGAAAIVWRALTSPSVPANHSRSLKHVYIKSATINRIVVAHRTVGLTLPVTAVNAVKRVITEVPWTGRARPVHAPPPRTSPLLLLLLLFLLLVAMRLHEKLILSVCSFAVACLDIGGVMECLCQRGYIGANCERWSCPSEEQHCFFFNPCDRDGEPQPYTQEVSRVYCRFF